MSERPACRRLALIGTAAALAAAANTSLYAGEPPSPTVLGLALHYDVQVAWIDAGNITMQLDQNGDRYSFSGTVATSRLMSRFFKWRGVFVAIGRIVQGFPRTDVYVLRGGDGIADETLISFAGVTTIHENDETKEVEQPPGSDFMSVTFLAPHCVPETTLHDGEHLYRLLLDDWAVVQLMRPPPHYQGPSTRCDYLFRYTDGSTRRVSLWMAQWQGRRLPVRVRVRVPLLPDGFLHLRTTRPREGS